MFLTDAQIVELTGRKRPHCQFPILRKMGLECKADARGYPKVAIHNFELVFGCCPAEKRSSQSNIQPDYGVLDAKKTKH